MLFPESSLLLQWSTRLNYRMENGVGCKMDIVNGDDPRGTMGGLLGRV